MRHCIFVIFLLLPLLGQAKENPKGTWPFRSNQFDKQGRYHGRWKVYINDGKSLIRNGRFKHGREIGKWRYYYPGGQLMMTERYRRNLDYINVKRYREDGTLEKTGRAKRVEDDRKVQYFWFGEWKVYAANGAYSHSAYYEKGNLMWEYVSSEIQGN
ncbi:hypothetical protein GCM10027443_13480 [Pontibacter brevis]